MARDRESERERPTEGSEKNSERVRDREGPGVRESGGERTSERARGSKIHSLEDGGRAHPVGVKKNGRSLFVRRRGAVIPGLVKQSKIAAKIECPDSLKLTLHYLVPKRDVTYLYSKLEHPTARANLCWSTHRLALPNCEIVVVAISHARISPNVDPASTKSSVLALLGLPFFSRWHDSNRDFDGKGQ